MVKQNKDLIRSKVHRIYGLQYDMKKRRENYGFPVALQFYFDKLMEIIDAQNEIINKLIV